MEGLTSMRHLRSEIWRVVHSEVGGVYSVDARGTSQGQRYFSSLAFVFLGARGVETVKPGCVRGPYKCATCRSQSGTSGKVDCPAVISPRPPRFVSPLQDYVNKLKLTNLG